MPRESYQNQLADLERRVLEMADLVTERTAQSLEAFTYKDEALARTIIDGDAEVNERYLELEGACIDLLALQQPVAGDLRFVAASFKIITDLERIADLATNLGQYTLQAERNRYPDIDISYIGEEALSMVGSAMTAYETRDTALAREVAARDDEVDDRCERASDLVVRDLIETEVADETTFADVRRMFLTIRDVERVGDHAVNVAARVLYMVENDDELIY
ncbi:phosphate signaling complex protein PhoU [Natronobiforma cellulositropha]|uniref:phosphate signaling complex protein PhoU n=1 Tax=Natronobiforma cellulositropha TaxID=1679076 RepID=UPI0021D5C2EC|nr:phosphate signaling complex protein PhoU [Natronobiforma cellulositropha]